MRQMLPAYVSPCQHWILPHKRNQILKVQMMMDKIDLSVDGISYTTKQYTHTRLSTNLL